MDTLPASGSFLTASLSLPKGRAGLTLRVLRRAPHGQKGEEDPLSPYRNDYCLSWSLPQQNQQRFLYSSICRHSGTTCFSPEHLHRGDIPSGNAAVWYRGGSISHLLGGAFLVFGAGLGLGVASEDTAGTQFCCYFMVIIFLHSHSGCTWFQGPWVTVGENRCCGSGAVGNCETFFATAAPSNAEQLEAHLLFVPGIPMPKNSVLGVVFP